MRLTPEVAAAELLRRRYAQNSLAEFAQAVDVPGKPASDREDEWLFKPVETVAAAHHILLMDTLDRVLTGEIENLMVFMPPGSAKSTYASVVFPAYAMGKKPGTRVILASYASAIAWKQSRRTRQIAKSAKYRPIFGTGLVHGNQSVEEWALENGSEYMAGGLLAGMTGNRANCFVGETQVLTKDGFVAIDSVTLNTEVLSYDHATGATVWGRVVARQRSLSADLVRIRTAAGRVVVCTADHPIYIEGRGYTQAALLGAGDALVVGGLSTVPRAETGRVEDVPSVLRRGALGASKSPVRVLREAGYETGLGVGKAGQEWDQAGVLQQVLPDDAVQQVARQAEGGEGSQGCANVAGCDLRGVWRDLSAGQQPHRVLLPWLRERDARGAHDGSRQFAVQGRQELCAVVQEHEAIDTRAGQWLRGVQDQAAADGASHRRGPGKQRGDESGGVVQSASPVASPRDSVALVERLCSTEQWVYDLQVEGHRNFFANEVLVHNCVIIDDPVAGREDAESETIRRKTREAYEDDLKTRLIPGGATIIIQTRWHESDLAGGILPEGWDGQSGFMQGRDGQQWFVLCIPAIADRTDDPLDRKVGQSLWPEWFTVGHFDKFRANPRTWSALFQQKPRPSEGAEFQLSWVQRFSNAPPKMNRMILVDPSSGRKKEKGDFSCMWVVGLAPDENAYVLDCVRGRLNLTERVNALMALHRKWKPLEVRYEHYGMQADIEAIKAEQDRQQYRFKITEVGGQVSKEDRIRRLVPWFQNGKIYLPNNIVYGNDDLIKEFLEKEYAAFPVSVHDDMFDSLARMVEPDLPLQWPKEEKRKPREAWIPLDPGAGY